MINITNLPYCRNIDKTVGFRQRPAATAVAHGGNCYGTVWCIRTGSFFRWGMAIAYLNRLMAV